MSLLRTLYDQAASLPSDINEHVPVLYKLGTSVCRITEFGTRTGRSTAAFLYARPEQLTAYDLHRHSAVDQLEQAAQEEGLDFRFIQADVRHIELEPTDMLFIDTWHVYEQMALELQFAECVSKYIVAHDTETFGLDGEARGQMGIWPAIGEFLRGNPQWEIHQVWTNNNGLVVLRRTSGSLAP